MKAKYKIGFYFLEFSLILLGILRINKDFYLGISFISQAVIIFCFDEYISYRIKELEKELEDKDD